MSKVTIINFGDPVSGAERGTKEGLIELASRVTSQSKALTPVDKGQLRNGGMWALNSGEEGGFNDKPGVQAEKKIVIPFKKNTAFAGSNVEYDPYVEFGTRNRAPQPHWRPAMAIVVKGQNAKEILAKIQREEMLGALKEGQKRETF